MRADARTTTQRPVLRNALSPAERAAILAVSNRPEYAHLPPSHVATAANQVWSWDITYLPTAVRGQYFYLYLIEDIYSRKAVGWEVHEQESGELGAKLLHRSVLSEQCLLKPPVLHSTMAHR